MRDLEKKWQGAMVETIAAKRPLIYVRDDSQKSTLFLSNAICLGFHLAQEHRILIFFKR